MIDLYDEIENGRKKFKNEIFKPIFQSIVTETAFNHFERIEFINCTFSFFELEELAQPKLTLLFKECTFNDAIQFNGIALLGLLFVDTKKITSIHISGIFTLIRFHNKNNALEGNIDLFLKIIEELNFENFNQKKGDFNLEVNKENDQNNDVFGTFFKNANFYNFNVLNSNFGYIANFKNVSILNSLLFEECNFQKSVFDDSKFYGITIFNNCEFNKSLTFIGIKYYKSCQIKFTDCNFNNFVNFNKSSFYKLFLENIIFSEIVSFQDTYFDIISIERTIFSKPAFFDDIQIKKINDCSRRTIRIIKQELQKTENKIDYNKFRVHEFNAYQQDILNNLQKFNKDKDHLNHRVRQPIQLKRDLFILRVNEFVSEYGTDWKRALKFSSFSGIILYLIFYLIENFKYSIDIYCWDNFARFISGLFRFFLLTDFYNPLINDRVYLTNPFSWFVFIVGKIFIAFGIYEMIQSFRKFKV